MIEIAGIFGWVRFLRWLDVCGAELTNRLIVCDLMHRVRRCRRRNRRLSRLSASIEIDAAQRRHIQTKSNSLWSIHTYNIRQSIIDTQCFWCDRMWSAVLYLFTWATVVCRTRNRIVEQSLFNIHSLCEFMARFDNNFFSFTKSKQWFFPQTSDECHLITPLCWTNQQKCSIYRNFGAHICSLSCSLHTVRPIRPPLSLSLYSQINQSHCRAQIHTINR